MEKLQNLYHTYEQYSPSNRCYLDGHYFNEVIREYDGLIPETLDINITDSGLDEFDIEPIKFPKSKFIKNINTPQLLRIRITISLIYNDDSLNSKYMHSNLLIIDHEHKEISKFDPMLEHEYHDSINKTLNNYFITALPDYILLELTLFPQREDKLCENMGMCIAYVIYMAMLYVLDVPIKFPNNVIDIKKFAKAIESNF